MSMDDKKQYLIKVIDPKTAEKLKSLGFSYIKEANFFSFHSTPELLSFLQKTFSKTEYVIENKLRF